MNGNRPYNKTFSRILFLGLSILFVATTKAQFTYLSESDHLTLLDRNNYNRNLVNSGLVEKRSEDLIFIPIQFTVVQTENDNNLIQLNELYEILCRINQDYYSTSIQFYFKAPPRFVTNTIASTLPFSESGIIELNKFRDRNSLNVFFTEKTLESSDNSTVLAYYSPATDWIVVKTNELKKVKNIHILSHEIGHYFSLLHTFNGWDFEPYNKNKHGEKVGLTAPDGKTPNENQNRSNCSASGDFICDTPPDYNFGFGWIKNGDPCHPFDQVVYDPTGQLVQPMERNFMGYFVECSNYSFTEEQVTLMNTDILSEKRKPVRDFAEYHASRELVKTPGLVSPVNGWVTDNTSLLLEWEPVPNAEAYLVQVEETDNGTLKEYISKHNQILLENLLHKSYTWRVKALNRTNVCTSFSLPGIFTIDNNSSVTPHHIEYNIRLRSNIINRNDFSCVLLMNNLRGSELDIELYDMSGKPVQIFYKQEYFPSGEIRIKLDFQERFSGGMYILCVSNRQLQKNFKIFFI